MIFGLKILSSFLYLIMVSLEEIKDLIYKEIVFFNVKIVYF